MTKDTKIAIPAALNEDFDPAMFNPEIINREIPDSIKLPDIQVDTKGNPIHHVKNKKVRKANAEISIGVEYLKEIKNCRDDIFYFAQNYFYIKVSDSPVLIKIPLRKYQKQMLYNLQNHYRNIFCCARQIGKCVTKDTMITIRDKKNGRISNVSIGDFYKSVKVEAILYGIVLPIAILMVFVATGVILWL